MTDTARTRSKGSVGPTADTPPAASPPNARADAGKGKHVHDKLTTRLGGAIRELYGSIWNSDGYDVRLRQAVQATLNSIGATGLLVRSRNLEVSLYCPAGPAWYHRVGEEEHQKFKAALEAAVASGRPEPGVVVLKLADGRGTADPSVRAAMAAALFYRPSDMYRQIGLPSAGVPEGEYDPVVDNYESGIRNTFLPLLADAFRHRDRRFAAFPPKIIERYWKDAPGAANGTRAAADKTRAAADEIRKAADKIRGADDTTIHQPPWVGDGMADTVTLSVDLRKSTYCMEYARSEKQFGEWLDQLVEKMRHIAHMHGGVFDKFTGDGALVHFLYHECWNICGQLAVDAAVHCAADMQRAVEIHMIELRKFLHHDSTKFGAGIAIDSGAAFWSADHRDNPIVVGKGVVGACRVGDEAARGAIRFTNQAYHEISKELRGWLGVVEQKLFSTKESDDDLPLLCWETRIERLDSRVGRGVQEVEAMCGKVKKMFDARRPKKP